MNISHSPNLITPAARPAEPVAPKLPARNASDRPTTVTTPNAGEAPRESEASVVAILGYN